MTMSMVLDPCARAGGAGDWWTEPHRLCTGSQHVGYGPENDIRCSCSCHVVPTITTAILDQWEESARADVAAGVPWSTNPRAILAVVPLARAGLLRRD